MGIKPFAIAASFAIVGIGAAQGYRVYQHRTSSPFPIWAMYAGRPFAEMNADAQRADGKPFTCRALVADSQYCEFVSPGTGTTRVVVDGQGMTAVVQFLPDTETSRLRDESRQLSARWNDVRSPENWVPDASRGERSVVHWATADGRWSATMRSGKFVSSPTSIATVDERRLSMVMESDPMAFLQLASRRLLDRPTRAEYDAAVARVFALREREAPQATARGAALVAPAMALPACVREINDPIETHDRWSQSRVGFGEETAAAIERAVAVAHRGARLILGDKALYVNPNGSAEEVRIAGVTRSLDDAAWSFSMQYVRRAEAAEHRMTDFDASNDCRAPTEIIVVSRGARGARGDVASARTIVVDEEALSTQITRLSTVQPGEDEQQLALSYTAAYATGQWYGTVEWDALLDLATGRILRRVPATAARKDASDVEKALILAASDTAPVGLHLTGISERDPLPRFIVLPPGPNGLTSGWMLLDLL